MEVILLERIEKLGHMGETVKVKPGFARNYLLPQKKALRATKENQARFEAQRTQLEATNLQRREEAEAVAAQHGDLAILVIRQAGESGMLYGSVSGRDISDAVRDTGLTIERRQVHLDAPIKSLGVYPVRVALHPEVVLTVKVTVARSQEEAMRGAAKAAAEPAEASEPVEEAASDLPEDAPEAAADEASDQPG